MGGLPHGASDYLSKSDLTAALLDRTIRYARRRHRDLQQMARIAAIDDLTGLLNRRTFLGRLSEALESMPPRSSLDDAYIVYIDIDNFKAINDGYGHQTGDRVIRHVAQSLRETVRSTDLVARFGGDEMIAAVFGIRRDSIQAFAEKLLASVHTPLTLGEVSLRCTISIGIARVTQTAGDVEEIVRMADSAMFAAKQRGRDGYHLYSSELDVTSRDRALIDQELLQAIEQDELALVYEPQIALSTGALIGFEALVRWPAPVRGPINTSDFVTIAEETGTIRALDLWVMHALTDTAARLFRRYDLNNAFRLSLNVSVLQLMTPDFVDAFFARLDALRVPASRIQIELTEQAIAASLASVVEQIQRLRRGGCRVALDDFGTGQSSLARLIEFSVDAFKLDVDTIAGIDTDTRARALVGATISLGRELGTDVVAEGVQRTAQLEVLNSLSCPTIQGWLISPSLSEHDMMDFVADSLSEKAGSSVLQRAIERTAAASNASGDR